MTVTGRGRRALATVAAFAILVVGVFCVAQEVVLHGFDSVDRNAGLEDGLRLRFALRAQVLQLENIGFSWADWTEAYDYLSAKAPKERLGFERAELADESLLPLGCDVFAYLTTDGAKVFGVSIDHQQKRISAVPKGFVNALRESGLSIKVPSHATRNAIINLSGTPMLVSMQRVHHSGRPSEWNGAIVVGRWVGKEVQKSLQDQLRLPVEVGAPTSIIAPVLGASSPVAMASSRSVAREIPGEQVQTADVMDTGGQASISLVEEDETILVKTLFADPRGRPVLWVTTEMPRVAREQGRDSLSSFFLALLGLGAVSVVVALSLQEALARTDAARQHERKTFDVLTRHLPDRLFIRDLNDQQAQAYGNSPSGPTSDWLDEALVGEQRVQRDIWLELLSASGERAEHEWDVNGGTWLELLTPVRANGEKAPVSHLISATIDISSRKRAEREKDVLLKEIHHRVKNNLQIVVSLLNLQADCVSDPEARVGFEDARARVRSMALIHEQLYRQSDLSRVDFGEYLQSLLKLLLRSQRHSQVRLNNQLEPVLLDIDIAVPCGLIVTELVTNAFKHAFAVPADATMIQGGQLSVRLCVEEEGHVLLQIEDDGPGLPLDFCLEESESLGLQIVDSLATQIGASVEVCCGENERGTLWTLRFEAVESSNKRILVEE